MIENLIQAAEDGDLESVQTFLDENPGIDINARGEDDYNALFTAVREGHYEVAKLLLESNANPDELTSRGTSPFASAAERGNFQMMDLLLEHNADVNATSGNLMTYVGLSLRYSEKNCTALDYLKEHGFNINYVHNSILGSPILGDFFSNSCVGGILYLLGTFQDTIDISNNKIRKSITENAGNKIRDITQNSCILSKISGYLVLTNLFEGHQLDEKDQNFISDISKRLLDMITEYNSDPDKLKYEFQKGSNYLELQTKEWATTQELQEALIDNKISNLYNFDYLLKSWSKTQEILPIDHPLRKALEPFMPLVTELVNELIQDCFNQDSFTELYQEKTILEIKQDSFLEQFKNIQIIQKNHPHLSQAVIKFQTFLDRWEFDSIHNFLQVKEKLLESSPKLKEMVEQNGLTKFVKIASHLDSDLFHRICEYIKHTVKELFNDVKLLPSSSTCITETQIIEASKTQEAHKLGEDTVSDSDAV